MIVSTALIRAIAESFPALELDVLASPANAPVLEGASYLRRVIVFDKRKTGSYVAIARELRAQHYDAVIDCMVTAPSVTTLLLMLASGAPYRIGIAGRGNDAAINVPVPAAGGEQHMTIELAALATAFGIDPASRDWTPFLEITPRQRDDAAAHWRSIGNGAGRRVLVNISAGPVTRRWQTDKYVEVIAHLRRRMPDASIFVTGAPNEADRIADVVAKSGATRAPTKSLMDVFALVATADFVFTPDTSVAHAASALRRPVVAMYRQREPRRWAVNRETGEVVEHTGDMLEDLPVAPAIAAIDRLLARQ